MIAEQYMNENAEFLKAFAIEDIRLRPIPNYISENRCGRCCSYRK